MDEHPIEVGIAVRDDDAPPVVKRNLDDLGAESFDRVQFVAGGAVGHDDMARNSHFPRAPRDPLRHVAGAGGVDSVGEAFPRGLEHHIAGAADFERSNGLKILELQVDIGRSVDIQPYEGSANGGSGETLAGSLYFGEWYRLKRLHS